MSIHIIISKFKPIGENKHEKHISTNKRDRESRIRSYILSRKRRSHRYNYHGDNKTKDIDPKDNQKLKND